MADFYPSTRREGKSPEIRLDPIPLPKEEGFDFYKAVNHFLSTPNVDIASPMSVAGPLMTVTKSTAPAFLSKMAKLIKESRAGSKVLPGAKAKLEEITNAFYETLYPFRAKHDLPILKYYEHPIPQGGFNPDLLGTPSIRVTTPALREKDNWGVAWGRPDMGKIIEKVAHEGQHNFDWRNLGSKRIPLTKADFFENYKQPLAQNELFPSEKYKEYAEQLMEKRAFQAGDTARSSFDKLNHYLTQNRTSKGLKQIDFEEILNREMLPYWMRDLIERGTR